MWFVLSLLPVFALGPLILALWEEHSGLRVAFIKAATLWAALAFMITETLSLFHAVTRTGLVAAWLVVVVGAGLYITRFRGSNLRLPARWVAGAHSSLDDLDAAFLTSMVFIVSIVGLVAFVAPPNTIDSLEYQMPRIVHWLQNASIRFYPTNDLRQLVFPPWAQYAMLQLHGISGGDRLDDLVQWFSFAGSSICVSLVARVLGASSRGQWLAAVLCMTIPQSVLAASGSKDGCVTAFWVVVSVYFALVHSKNPNIINSVALGAGVGLALLTKTTVAILLPPLLLAAVLAFPVQAFAPWLKGVCMSFLVILALNGPHLIRVYGLYHFEPGELESGEPIKAPPKDLGVLINETYGVPPTVSNVIRNLALHAGSPSAKANALMERAIARLLSAIGQPASDPRTTFNSLPFQITRPTLHEDTQGNHLHLLLTALSCMLLFWRWRSPASRPAFSLALGVVASFLVFCIVLKWQPWHTSLHLPLFVVGSALAAVVLAEVSPKRLAGAAGMIFVLAAMPAVFENHSRPVFTHSVFGTPRVDQYFADIPDQKQPYKDAVELVRTLGCSSIGLDPSLNAYEYPLQALLGNLNGRQPVKLVNISYVSLHYATSSDQEEVPCLICPGCLQKKYWTSILDRFRTRTTIGDVEVLTGSRPPSLLTVPGVKDETTVNSRDHENGDLAISALMASAAIASRQQLSGSWLTSYTGDARYLHPRPELNTFLSSIMVDVLDPVATDAGLGDSLQRARNHLTGQIENSGLVRYHGKPDGPTVGTSLGCLITPDADDTSLVWRIAPSTDHRLLPAALATLGQFRRPDGLYQTWLASRNGYQCIDPGSDPNPADVAIQMHVFLLLAQSDPPAAQALCRALQSAVTDDRIWVYYKIAPLIPILRQADLKRAGCSLNLPPYRLRTTAGQEDWIATSQLLLRLQGVSGPAPQSVEALDLLRELSLDDFAALRHSPPLLYHNDLSASASRFYWSEEFGYAVWLRLYFENMRHGSIRNAAKEENARCCLR